MKEVQECMYKYQKLGREAAYLLGHSPEKYGLPQIERLGYEVRIRTGLRKPITESIALEALVAVMKEYGGLI